MNKEINVFLILSLVLLVPALVFANQNKNAQQQSQQAEKLMQERLKNSEEKIDIKLKAFEKDFNTQQKAIKNEIILRDDGLNNKLNLILGFGSFLIAFLSIVGITTIRNWIKQSIETQTDKQVKTFLTRHYIEELIKEEGQEAVNSLISELEIKGQAKLADIENLRNDYENSLNNLKNKEIDINKPLTEETVDNLEQFKEKLAKVKDEEKYSFDDWYYKGVDEYGNRDYTNAIKSFTRAIEKDSSFVNAYIYRGIVFKELKEYEKAIEDFSKAIELESKHANSFNNRAIAYQSIKQHEKAIKDLSKAVELRPKDALTYSNRGVAYQSIKQYEKAIEDYNKAIEVDTKHLPSYKNLSEVLIITGDYNTALTYIEKGLTKTSDIKDESVLLYLDFIAKRILKVDSSKSEKKFDKLIKDEFEISWSFDEIEKWLRDSEISDEDKKYIIEKINLFKKHLKE